jgi:hypothetical protein
MATLELPLATIRPAPAWSLRTSFALVVTAQIRSRRQQRGAPR